MGYLPRVYEGRKRFDAKVKITRSNVSRRSNPGSSAIFAAIRLAFIVRAA
jgi:hypothetical protein